MSLPPAAFAQNGSPILLGNKIGGGGEGTVYEDAHRPSRAVKIYRPDKRASRAPKIAEMIAQDLGRKTTLVAFPRRQVFDKQGLPTGFVMPRVQDHRILFELYNPASRRLHFPRADFGFLVRVATNIARALASVHYAGCVVGDVNESGVLVSQAATVALIDADSFQVTGAGQRFLCGVGKEEYTAPELIGCNFATVPRSRNHDAFALAVLLFQLLFIGRSPFVGRSSGADIELIAAMKNHCFAYSRQRRTLLAAPPGTPLLSDLSPILAAQFESAFAPTGNAGLRPRPLDWVDSLSRFESELVQCSRAARHVYHPSADKCTWCRIASEIGHDAF